MSTQTIPVQLPQPLYRRLERLAELAQLPVETLITRTLASSLPPLPDDLPEEMRAELVALEPLGDDALWAVARSTVAPEQSHQLHMLLEKSQQGALSDEEQSAIERLRSEADRLMFRKAYAYSGAGTACPRWRASKHRASLPMVYITAALRRQVQTDAGPRCGYCRSPEALTGMPRAIEHIIPEAGGVD